MNLYERRNMTQKIVWLALMLCAPVMAEEVHKTLDADASSEVRIINTSGNIVVDGWSRNEVDLEADLDDGVKELIFERHGKEIVIEVKLDQSRDRTQGTDLVVKIPQGSSLSVESVSADATVRDVRGRLDMNSVSGDIDATVFESNVQTESVSGDVGIHGNGSTLRLQATTVSGDIDLDNVTGEIRAEVVSGDITIVHSKGKEVKLQTVNGDINYRSELVAGGRMDVETVNGEVDIHFDGKVSGRFEIETFNGGIDNCFGPKAQRTSQYAPGYELSFTEGEGDGRVTIRTLNGDLTLCKD